MYFYRPDTLSVTPDHNISKSHEWPTDLTLTIIMSATTEPAETSMCNMAKARPEKYIYFKSRSNFVITRQTMMSNTNDAYAT